MCMSLSHRTYYTLINTESEIKICNLETFLFQAFKQVDLTTVHCSSINYVFFLLYNYFNIWHTFTRFMLFLYVYTCTVYGDDHVCLCRIKYLTCKKNRNQRSNLNIHYQGLKYSTILDCRLYSTNKMHVKFQSNCKIYRQ